MMAVNIIVGLHEELMFEGCHSASDKRAANGRCSVTLRCLTYWRGVRGCFELNTCMEAQRTQGSTKTVEGWLSHLRYFQLDSLCFLKATTSSLFPLTTSCTPAMDPTEIRQEASQGTSGTEQNEESHVEHDSGSRRHCTRNAEPSRTTLQFCCDGRTWTVDESTAYT